MNLCQRSDLEARTSVDLGQYGDDQIDAAISDASATVSAVAPRVSLPVPGIVVGITARLALQLLAQDPMNGAVQSESLGGYSVTYRYSASELLGEDDMKLLKPWAKVTIGTVNVDSIMAAVK